MMDCLQLGALGKVARVLGTQFGLSVTEGGLVHLLHPLPSR